MHDDMSARMLGMQHKLSNKIHLSVVIVGHGLCMIHAKYPEGGQLSATC